MWCRPSVIPEPVQDAPARLPECCSFGEGAAECEGRHPDGHPADDGQEPQVEARRELRGRQDARPDDSPSSGRDRDHKGTSLLYISSEPLYIRVSVRKS